MLRHYMYWCMQFQEYNIGYIPEIWLFGNKMNGNYIFHLRWHNFLNFIPISGIPEFPHFKVRFKKLVFPTFYTIF